MVGVTAESSPHNFDEIQSDIKGQVKKLRVRLSEFFRDFDKLHIGKITAPQFRRGLTVAKIAITDADCAVLAKQYQLSEGMVDYTKFCDDIEEVFAIKHLEKSSPTRAFALGSSPLQTRAFAPAATTTASTRAAEDVLPEALAKIALRMQQRGVRLVDSLSDHDPLRCGLIGAGYIRGGISRLGIDLEAADYDAIEAAFRAPDGRVRYRDFLAAVEKADPAPRRTTRDVTSSEAARATLERVAAQVRLRRTLFMPFFRDIDTLRRNRVTVPQFQRTLVRLNIVLSERDLEALSEAYADGGDLYYTEFVRDVEALAYPRQEEQPTSQLTASAGKFAALTVSTSRETETVDVEDVLARLRAAIFQRRVRVAEFLRDFDSLRCGVISKAQLRTGLHSAGFDLTDAEHTAICDAFSAAPKRADGVRWQDFSEALEAVFTTKGLEKSPAAVLKATSPTKRSIVAAPMPLSPVPVASPAARVPAPLSEASPAVQRAVARIVSWIKPRNADLAPFFYDFDPLRRGRVATGKFGQALEACGLKLPLEDTRLLQEHYALSPVECDYRTFMQHLLAEMGTIRNFGPADTVVLPAVAPTTPSTAAATRDHVEMAALMDRLRVHAVRRRVRAIEFLRDYDRLHSGIIPKSKFLSGLLAATFDINPAEQEALAAAYEVDAGRVNYTKFCDDIESAFVQKNLEKTPTLEAQSIDVREPEPLGMNYSPAAAEVVAQVKRIVQTRRVYIKPSLQDFDRVHRGRITQKQFCSVLRSSGFSLTEDELAVIAQAYADSRQDVYYIKFVHDLE